MNKAHKKRRYDLQVGFAKLGFRGLTSFLNVCLYFNTGLGEIELSRWWRNAIKDSDKITEIHNKLEDILNALRYE